MAAEVPNSLNWVSFVTGILSFALTTLNLIALYGNFVATIRSAPNEIRDSLGNLRQQLCEERQALRHQSREIRTKTKLRQRIYNLSDRHASHEARSALSYAEQTLPLHYLTLRDLWRTFKELERPFLIASGYRAEAIHNGAPWGEGDLDEKVRADFEKHGEQNSFADWSAVYKCDFAHRFIWWQIKDDVKKLGDEVMRVMARRTEREVTYTRMMVKQIFQGDGPAQIVDVRPPRRPPGGGGGGGGGARRRMSWGSGPVRRSPIPMRRSPAPVRRAPVPVTVRPPHHDRYKKHNERSSSSSSSTSTSSNRDNQATRRGMDVPRRSGSVISEHRHSHPKSDAATIGKHQHRPDHQPQAGSNRWEQFRGRPSRRYDLREYFEGRGRDHSRIIEVIPESEIDYFSPRSRHKNDGK
ncbi:hypothetical protein HER10_EVM0010022 [Colletotrichum scovillei]|uniref:uncharacterized protein n=1 Tax=Colletotrichum scovillei TaxID=1209932 RepID=UPI0015C3BAFE|nr:uncharacterized protein HER10_EVM0010022 [Colletotrichum scovillei]KAF4778753.1 hypothetical protein HER10_EVM0010022 [Colletotrichum scovillei]